MRLSFSLASARSRSSSARSLSRSRPPDGSAIGRSDDGDPFAAFEQRCEAIQHNRHAALVRQSVIAANPELRERDLTKHAELAASMAEALRKRGAPEQTATLAADTAMSVFRGALARWYEEPEQQILPTLELTALVLVQARTRRPHRTARNGPNRPARIKRLGRTAWTVRTCSPRFVSVRVLRPGSRPRG
ncbi:hypothetical protein GCM10009548_89200 [Streptomyces malaysiensis subsp. malaysiensis]